MKKKTNKRKLTEEEAAEIAAFKAAFRERFRQLLWSKFESANAFAEASGEAPGNVNAWKSGRSATPPLYRIPAICKTFGISADYLLGLTDNPAPYPAQTAIGTNIINSPDSTNNSCHDCATVAALTAAIKALTERKQ